MSSRSLPVMFLLSAILLAFGLAHSQIVPQRNGLDCANALRGWSTGRSFYRPTATESKWRDGMLVNESWARSMPAPDWCTGPFELPATIGYDGLLACRALYGNEADRAKGKPGEAAKRRKAEAFAPILEERLNDAGWTLQDDRVVQDMQSAWESYGDWSKATVDQYRDYCDTVMADYPVALEVDAYMEGGEFFTDRCLAVVITQAEAGRWDDLDPDIRTWALENEKRPYEAREEPYGACYTRWTPAMSYSRADVSVFEVAPLEAVIDTIENTKNMNWAARAFSLANRRKDAASQAALDRIRLAMTPEFYALSQFDGMQSLPSLERLEALPTAQVLSLVAATRNQDWQQSALAILKARPDVPSMVATADFLSGTRLPLQDSAGAAELYGRAADQGSVYARYRIGLAHLYGFGVPADPALGREVIADAARLGNPDAAYKLRLLDAGGETKQDAGQKAESYAYWKSFAAARMDFIMRCGYIPPDEQHEWMCGN